MGDIGRTPNPAPETISAWPRNPSRCFLALAFALLLTLTLLAAANARAAEPEDRADASSANVLTPSQGAKGPLGSSAAAQIAEPAAWTDAAAAAPARPGLVRRFSGSAFGVLTRGIRGGWQRVVGAKDGLQRLLWRDEVPSAAFVAQPERGTLASDDIVLASADTVAQQEGPVYLVREIVPRFTDPHPQHPSLEAILAHEIELGRLPDGYIAPRPGAQIVKVSLNELAAAPVQLYHVTALAAINQGILGALNARGLGGVTVQTNPADIDPLTGEDRRTAGQTDVGVDILTGRIGDLHVAEFETFGFGDRISEEENAGHPVHQRIKDGSPIQPTGSVSEGTTDLLRTDLLEDYVAYLNRHPGRTVVAELTPSRIEPGVAFLDYKILEEKPWTAYMQTSKTGTEETNEWRHRFGFRHTQLTGEDDIFRFDYVTALDFSDVHGFFTSYEAPMPWVERLRWRVNAGFSEYDASEIGVNRADFSGRQHELGFELIGNLFQYRNFFVDMVGKIRWQNIHADDKLTDTEGDENMFLPGVGLRAARETDAMWFRADVGWERSLGGGSSLDFGELRRLGRVDPDERWQVLRWDAGLSFYVEPLLDRIKPGLVDGGGRAHEMLLSTKGQEAFDNRLIPQEEMIVGGLFTVRGYPQASLAGDSVTMGTAEYRFHLPRALSPRARPSQLPVVGDFKLAPQRVNGRADWDLVLSLFTDLAKVRQSNKVTGEIEGTFFGAGVGVELMFLRNFSIRYNFGVALRDIDNFNGTKTFVDSGDAEHYFVFSLLY